MAEKSYTEAEAAALLGRAARLQAARQEPDREGLTLEEIKAAAAEAGIDPRFVEMASAASFDHGQAYWSIPTGVGRSMVVRSSLTDDRWNRMVDVFSHELGGPGRTDVRHQHRTWSRGSLRISAEEVSGRIRLHAETEWGKELELPIALTVVGAIGAMMMGAVALAGMEWTIGVVAALMTILVVGLFSAFRGRTSARQEQVRSTFESVLNRCAGILQDEGSTDAEGDRVETEGGAGRIELPAAEPTGSATPRPAPRGRLGS